MTREGPPLERLLRRVAETADDFLAPPRLEGKGAVHVAAVVHDLCLQKGARPDAQALAAFAGDARGDRNRLAVTLLLCWLLADELICPPMGDLLALLDGGARDLEATPASAFVADPERREELVRVALARLGLRPAGESEAEAEDRLTTSSSAERERVLRASRDAEQRARAIREALARKAAEQSADKWTRD